MNQDIAARTDFFIPKSKNAQANKFITTINDKMKQLSEDGMTRADQDLLKNHRLSFVWADPPDEFEPQNATAWRKSRARRAYADIQDADSNIFLAVILVIPPTECAKTSFDTAVQHLLTLENYESCRLNLSEAAQKFFKSIAAERGFTSNRRYLDFMQALFPQNQDPRQIEFAYSLISLSDIPAFFAEIQRGIHTSEQVKKERAHGMATSSCVTVFVPTSQKDGSCNIVIDREVVMDIIHKFQLSDLKLE